METTIPQILVVGSSGMLARLIIKEIIASFGIEALSISDYKTDRLHALKKFLNEKHGKVPKTKVIDITSIESVSLGIENVDYVIVPVSQKRPVIQEICLQKGITCIDLSVSEEFIDEVLGLHTQAIESKGLLLVAAGLFPGLSGIIARSLYEHTTNSIVDIGLIQSKDGMAGSTGIADMLQLFNQNVDYNHATGSSLKKGFSHSKSFQFDNRFGSMNLRLANFIESKYLQQRADVLSNYWSGFDDEKFNKLIAFLRRLGILVLFDKSKYRLKLAQVFSKMKKVAEEEIVGLFGQTDNENRFFVLLESDYSATAACAVAFVKLLTLHEKRENGVFFPFELFELENVLQLIDHKIEQ